MKVCHRSLGAGLQIHRRVLKTWLHWIKVFHVLCYSQYGSLFHPMCDGHTVTVARHSNKESFVFRMCLESDLEHRKHWDQIRSWSVQTVIMTVKIISFGLRRQLANERVTVTVTYLFKSGCVARINIPWPWPWHWKWRSSVSARRTERTERTTCQSWIWGGCEGESESHGHRDMVTVTATDYLFQQHITKENGQPIPISLESLVVKWLWLWLRKLSHIWLIVALSRISCAESRARIANFEIPSSVSAARCPVICPDMMTSPLKPNGWNSKNIPAARMSSPAPETFGTILG